MKLTSSSANRLSCKLDNIVFTPLVLLALAALASGSTAWSQTYPTQIGAESSDRPTGFIDAFKDQGRLATNSSGAAVPTDANGNPLSDATVVIFDDRPVPAWAPPIDDPAQYQPNMSGTYTMSFTGQAVLGSVAGNPTLKFSNQSYSSATNTTTVNVNLPGGPSYAAGPALMVISFTNTQLTASSGTNTGIANLQVIRPGFTLAEAANPTEVFDPAFVSAFAPFGYIRYMGWLGTNQNPFIATGCASSAPACSSVNTPTIGWSERSRPRTFIKASAPASTPVIRAAPAAGASPGNTSSCWPTPATRTSGSIFRSMPPGRPIPTTLTMSLHRILPAMSTTLPCC